MLNSVQMIMLKNKMPKNKNNSNILNKSTHIRFKDFQGASNKLFQETEKKNQLVEWECWTSFDAMRVRMNIAAIIRTDQLFSEWQWEEITAQECHKSTKLEVMGDF